MFAYGPVPSRRLGKSIGVSPIPAKTCSYSCIYCQLGRTNQLQIKRESFFPKKNIFHDIQKVIKGNSADYITFVGDGEPTLCKDLGWLIDKCKNNFDIPIAVITNGSLLFQAEVRKDLQNADVVMPTIDAGTDDIFRKINRAHKNINFDEMIQGIVDFREEFTGKIWAEVMLVKDVNDSEKTLKNIKWQLDKINPDKIYITTPVRPPAEKWVTPPKPEKILYAQTILNNTFNIIDRENGDFGVTNFANASEALYEISSRHPLREEQAMKIERKFSQQGTLKKMLNNGELIKYNYQNIFYIFPKKFKTS
ncbi:MAG: radical SAM protein [Candidatus Marinimicrobia bacterium]|nr:radical SAM protein [Candidatus Neomarinimicrobiota bacterium]